MAGDYGKIWAMRILPVFLAVLALAADAAPRRLKTCVMQPPYALDPAGIEASMQWEFDALRRCDESLDLIVLPEASDRQARLKGRDDTIAAAKKYNAPLLAACAETARRCKATLFVHALDFTPLGERTTTFAFAFARESLIMVTD